MIPFKQLSILPMDIDSIFPKAEITPFLWWLQMGRLFGFLLGVSRPFLFMDANAFRWWCLSTNNKWIASITSILLLGDSVNFDIYLMWPASSLEIIAGEESPSSSSKLIFLETFFSSSLLLLVKKANSCARVYNFVM